MKTRLPILTAFVLVTGLLSAQWKEYSSGFTIGGRGLQHMDLVDSNVIWGLAWDGLPQPGEVQEFSRSVDGGMSWTSSVMNGVGSTFNAASISAVDEFTAWAAMFDTTNGEGAIFKTIDGGNNWVRQNSGAFQSPFGHPNAIHFWDQNNGIVMGDPNLADSGWFSFEIYTTSDGGMNWQRVPRSDIPPHLSAEMGMITQMFVLDSIIWFPTTAGRVYKSLDRGMSWQVHDTPLSGSGIFANLTFEDSQMGMAVARSSPYKNATDEGIYRTTDGGENWQKIQSGLTGGIGLKNHVAHIPGSDPVYIVTASETAPFGSAYTADFGNTWHNIDNMKHYRAYFLNERTGFSGSFSDSSGARGVFRWEGGSFINTRSLTLEEPEIFPNPARSVVYLKLPSDEGGELMLLDSRGSVVLTREIESGVDTKIALDHIRNGSYSMIVKRGDRKFINTLIVSK